MEIKIGVKLSKKSLVKGLFTLYTEYIMAIEQELYVSSTLDLNVKTSQRKSYKVEVKHFFLFENFQLTFI